MAEPARTDLAIAAGLERLRALSEPAPCCGDALGYHIRRKSRDTLREARDTLDAIQNPPALPGPAPDLLRAQRLIASGLRRLGGG